MTVLPQAGPSVRERQFPTRHYPYRSGCGYARLASEEDPLEAIPAGSVVRFFLGKDDQPVVLDSGKLRDIVKDPFASIVLAPGHRPLTLKDVIAVLNADQSELSLPDQRIYRVADGGQIAWSQETAGLDRHLRIVVTRHRNDSAELFISTTAPFDSEDVFLQIFAWDPANKAYNFYERRRGIWNWAGNSWGAHETETSGLGPFDSHVNGGPVMKELKLPWLHWHSQSAQIRDGFLAPDDPLRKDAFYQAGPPALRGAEDLELIVRAGTKRWTSSRVQAAIESDGIRNVRALMKHVLGTTTVNLVSAADQSASLSPGDVVRLPTTFFLNSECLLDDMAIPASLGRLRISAERYIDCLRRYSVVLQDGQSVLERDAFFAFAVPEPSFDDRAVIQELMARGFLSRRLAATLLMIDFPNPIFSARREKLLEHLPDEASKNGTRSLDVLLPDSIRASSAARDASTVEAEFLRLWDLSQDTWEASFGAQLEAYWAALRQVLDSDSGVDAIFRVAESRRRQFRKRPLAEFGLTLAVASKLELPRPLAMTSIGTTVEVEPDLVA